MSKAALARKLGTTYQRVILWEQDKHGPSPVYAERLAATLGGTIDEYLPPAYEPLLIRSRMAELAAALERNAEGQEALAETVEELRLRVLDLERPRTQARPARPRRKRN